MPMAVKLNIQRLNAAFKWNLEMNNFLRALFSFVCGLLMFGCNGRVVEDFGLEKLSKGISTEADVRSAMGEPAMIWPEDNGTRTLEYPKGPEGHRTFMVNLDAQGIFQAYTQVLTQQNFATIKAGMSRDQVRRILGKPRTIVKFGLKNEEVWDWRYLEGPTTERFFNVHFDANSGTVTQTSVTDPVKG